MLGCVVAAVVPEDLGRLIVERLNAGDVDGVVALYEDEAILALPGGEVAHGHDAIRRFYSDLLASRPTFQPGRQCVPLVHGDVALTSSRLGDGGVTAEVARRQPDGTWRWIIDQPDILS